MRTFRTENFASQTLFEKWWLGLWKPGMDVDTKHTSLLKKSYIATGIEYFNSVTCITKPDNNTISKLGKFYCHGIME